MLILAGGLAERLRPLTEDVPKALVPVAGRPIADHQLRWLGSQGVTDVVFAIGYLGGEIREYVGDGGRWGLGCVIATKVTPSAALQVLSVSHTRPVSSSRFLACSTGTHTSLRAFQRYGLNSKPPGQRS